MSCHDLNSPLIHYSYPYYCYHNISFGKVTRLVGLWPLAFWDCGFESRRGHGCLSWVMCVLRQRSLRRADHSSGGVLPTVVRRCVWSRNLVNEEAMTHWGLSRQQKKTNKVTRIRNGRPRNKCDVSQNWQNPSSQRKTRLCGPPSLVFGQWYRRYFPGRWMKMAIHLFLIIRGKTSPIPPYVFKAWSFVTIYCHLLVL